MVDRIADTEKPKVEYRLLNPDGSLPFGRWENRTPNAVHSVWTPKGDWSEPEITQHENLFITPFCNGVQYGRLVFEGMKAFPYSDAGVRLFRPHLNAARISHSAEGMILPPVPQELAMEALEAIVDHERDWLPRHIEGGTFYIRPFVLDVTKGVGVGDVKKGMEEVMFAIGLFPSGPYFSADSGPISLLINQEKTRTSPGGNGDKKWCGNYGGAYPAMHDAYRQGLDQVIFVEPVDRDVILEGSVFNVIFVYKDDKGYRVVTPELNGQILPGITRKSVLEVAPDIKVDGMPVAVEEKLCRVSEILPDINEGRLVWAGAVGTAAVVNDVRSLVVADREYVMNDGKKDPLVGLIRKTITDIQFGRAPDTYGFMTVVGRQF
jgi:branched-chain amino acid aminotransferase